VPEAGEIEYAKVTYEKTLCQVSCTLLSTVQTSCSTNIAINVTRVVPKVISNNFLHANWEQQTKESMVVDGTSCCVILECLVTSIACIT